MSAGLERTLTIAATTAASTLLSTGTTTVLSVLAQASANATQTANTQELSEIEAQINKRLTDQIAALQPTPDAAVSNALAQQIAGLDAQRTAISGYGSQWGGNSYILSDLSTQLAKLQTYAANGDGANFDAALSAATTDVADLTPVAAPAPFRPDQIAPLQSNGLGIGSSASYDLSTQAGQTAAAAAVNAAQSTVGQIFSIVTGNQLLASSISSSLTVQIDSLTSVQQQAQSTNQTEMQTQVNQLTQQAQNQIHLIELALGNTQTIASMIAAAENPPQPVTSVFQALQNAAGATPSSYGASQAAPAILSLLA